MRPRLLEEYSKDPVKTVLVERTKLELVEITRKIGMDDIPIKHELEFEILL